MFDFFSIRQLYHALQPKAQRFQRIPQEIMLFHNKNTTHLVIEIRHPFYVHWQKFISVSSKNFFPPFFSIDLLCVLLFFCVLTNIYIFMQCALSQNVLLLLLMVHFVMRMYYYFLLLIFTKYRLSSVT